MTAAASDLATRKDTAQPFQITEPGLYLGIPDDVYHADPVAGGSVSQSQIKHLVPPSTPAHFKAALSAPRTAKRDFDHGHAAHQLVLGVGPELKEIRAADWRSPRVRDTADELRNVGILPLLTKDFEIVVGMATALRRHPLASELLSDGRPEVSGFVPDTANGVWRRFRIDWLRSNDLVDYKTARSAAPAAFEKAAWDYGYYIQHPWYVDGARLLGHPAERFRFVIQEKTAPYLVSVCELDDRSVEKGRADYLEALDVLAECLATDEWPGYPDDTMPVTLPRWAFPRDTVAADDDDTPATDPAAVVAYLESLNT